MASAVLTGNGQITIPESIRAYLKLETGSIVDFVIDETGQVKVIPLTIPVEALSGILHHSDMNTASLEEMESAIQQGAVE